MLIFYRVKYQLRLLNRISIPTCFNLECGTYLFCFSLSASAWPKWLIKRMQSTKTRVANAILIHVLIVGTVDAVLKL
jgi:hypothetical protein